MTDEMLSNMSNEELIKSLHGIAIRLENAIATIDELRESYDNAERSMDEIIQLFGEVTKQ